MSPIIPEWYMIDGEAYVAPTGTLQMAWVNAVPTSETTATITFTTNTQQHKV